MEIDRYLTEAEHGRAFDYQGFSTGSPNATASIARTPTTAQRVMTVVADDVRRGAISCPTTDPLFELLEGRRQDGKSASGPVRSSPAD